jgi:hypothetical protein
MVMKKEICQSCGMPLNQDNKGTEMHKSKHIEYCHFCYENGEFTNPSLTFDEQKDKLINMSISKFNMPKEEAQKQADAILPGLKRWKN